MIPFCVSSQNNTFRSLVENQFIDFSTDTSKHISITPNVYGICSINEESNISNTFLLRATLTANISNNLTVISHFDYLTGNHNYLMKEYQDSLGVFPAFGLHDKRFQFNAKYKINKFITTDFGNGKQFIGNGYQSLLLSDVASSYPYLKLTTEFGRVKYYNMYTTFINPDMSDFGRKKHSTIHYLDFAVSKNINFGVFECILWQSKSLEEDRGYEFAYINPVIFYRPVEFSKQSDVGNALIGANFIATFYKTSFYGQVMIDDLNISRAEDGDDGYIVENSNGFLQNKFGYQIGLKGGTQKIKYLFEYNQVQPYTYAHKTILQNYSHMNQALAHPLGANFKEIVLMTNFKKDKWNYSVKITSAKVGLDSLGTHYGQNIFESDNEASTGGKYSDGNFNGQGVLTHLNTIQAEVTYDYKWFDIFGSIFYKSKKSDLLDQTSLFYSIGLRTFPFSDFIDY